MGKRPEVIDQDWDFPPKPKGYRFLPSYNNVIMDVLFSASQHSVGSSGNHEYIRVFAYA
jgi:hypothetical protein